MPEANVRRKLTAMLYADVAGYSRLTGTDEVGTHRTVMSALDHARDTIEANGGVVLRYAGDALLAEFASVVACVDAAIAVQGELERRNAALARDRRVLLRIGINLGEVLQDRGEIFGDGVNVAARLEALAPPGGICITGQVARQVSGKLVAAFAYAGRHKLKNIARPVEVWCWPAACARGLWWSALRRRRVLVALGAALAAAVAVAILVADREPTVPTGPRIAVIPFEELGAGDAYFSDGLTKDINAYLSRFTNLFVIAPGSVSGIRGDASCAGIRRELRADYILGGAVRRSQDRLRITTTFTDARTCRQLSAPGPYDRDLSVSSVLDVELEIARKIAAAVGSADAPLFNANIQSEIRRKAPESLEAYDCVLLSYWFYETFEPDRHRRARACLENAVAIDPDYSLGWSRLASTYIESKKYVIDTPPDWAERARSAAMHARRLDPDNPNAYYALAILTQMTTQDRGECRTYAERAIELNPNDAFVLADLGTWMGYAGEWKTGRGWVSRAMLLNPKHQGWLYQVFHLDAYLRGDYAEARDLALKMNLPDNYMVQASLTATYAMNGEREKAQATLVRLLGLRPDYGNDPRLPFRTRGMPTDLVERLMEGLRRAGLEVPPAE